jgi:DNA-binding transcriptional ArsR family regulator
MVPPGARSGCVDSPMPLMYNQMVVGMLANEATNEATGDWTDDDVDRIFQALADRTRRDILRRTMREDASVTTLARRYDMSFAAVQKHVAVLERADLVAKQRQGREQLVRSNPATVHRAQQLLDRLESMWRDRLDRLDDLLDQLRDESEQP